MVPPVEPPLKAEPPLKRLKPLDFTAEVAPDKNDSSPADSQVQSVLSAVLGEPEGSFGAELSQWEAATAWMKFAEGDMGDPVERPVEGVSTDMEREAEGMSAGQLAQGPIESPGWAAHHYFL